jgi:two-component system, response regulator FlrC
MAHSHDVLVVEDDSNTRQAISIAMERKQMRVMVAEDGVEAIRVLRLRQFCVVVLDLNLPKTDGYGVIVFIKENLKGLPVIVITGLQPDQLSGLDRSVVQNVLFKPFPPEDLAERVYDLCDQG